MMLKTAIASVALIALFLVVPVTPTIDVFPKLSVFPREVIQGEPVRIRIAGVEPSEVTGIFLDKKPLDIQEFEGEAISFVGIGIHEKEGTRSVSATFAGGSSLHKEFVVRARPLVEAPIGIPQKLGGNTMKASNALIRSLADENKSLYAVETDHKQLWSEPFIFPVDNPYVTDTYGYSRQTVGNAILHKGTDFRAPKGTPVYAMNDGIVKSTRTYRVYGNTITIDHGFGLHTLYMHLSKMLVQEGEHVERGQTIGSSGDTGYAESPHLHVSVWIGGESIDPMKFMKLF